MAIFTRHQCIGASSDRQRAGQAIAGDQTSAGHAVGQRPDIAAVNHALPAIGSQRDRLRIDVEKLGVDSDVSPAVAGFNLRFHTIARAVLIPVFGH